METLREALLKYPKPEIFNTDQGSRPRAKPDNPAAKRGQDTSYIHTQTLKNYGITISMTSKGRATDNIAIERFFRTAKTERIYLKEYGSIKELKEDLKNYIHFYNFYRHHQTLGYKKPMEVYDKELYLKTIQKGVKDETLNHTQSPHKFTLCEVA